MPSSTTWPPTARVTDVPFAFGVAGYVDAPAEGDVTGGEGFGQGGFAAADLAGQEDVGIGQYASAVELPGVVAEGGARPGILADEGALGAETFLGEEGVGAGEHLASGPMRGDAKRAMRSRRSRARFARPGQVTGPASLVAHRDDLGLFERQAAYADARAPAGGPA